MIYLDYSATTPANPQVISYFTKVATKYPANPNSNHALGKQANQIITQTTKKISKLLSIKETEIIYTSGSSESNNLAIKGACFQKKGNHIITTNFEHSSVIAPINDLQRQGYQVDILKPTTKGQIDIQELKQLITNQTVLISITAVNSEIGILEPIEKIGKYLKKEHPNIIYHVDLTQLITKVQVDLSNIDLASFSAHKFYGIKGIGILIKKEHLKIKPLIQGGKSTTIYRSGTPPTALIASLGKALELAMQNIEENYQKVTYLNKYLKNKLSQYEYITINSNNYCLPHIINFSLKDTDPSKIQDLLSQYEIYISTQTACANAKKQSPSVYALTQNKSLAETSLRVSISHHTTTQELDKFIETLTKIYRKEKNLKNQST